jgi:hypothetical protein
LELEIDLKQSGPLQSCANSQLLIKPGQIYLSTDQQLFFQLANTFTAIRRKLANGWQSSETNLNRPALQNQRQLTGGSRETSKPSLFVFATPSHGWGY